MSLRWPSRKGDLTKREWFEGYIVILWRGARVSFEDPQQKQVDEDDNGEDDEHGYHNPDVEFKDGDSVWWNGVYDHAAAE